MSRDKRYLALVKPRTTSDADIYLHDRQSKTHEEHHRTHRRRSTTRRPTSPPDGSKLLFVSDSGREFASLRSYDIATGATEPVYEQNWDISAPSTRKAGSTSPST